MRLIIKIISMFILLISISSANDVFVSLKKNKVNVRYGPSFDSDVKYVYKKINLPLKQIDKKENFRRIVDFKNNGGWIHISQLKKINSVIPLKDKILFKKPSNFSNKFNLSIPAMSKGIFELTTILTLYFLNPLNATIISFKYGI